jgi:hypothetical protein
MAIRKSMEDKVCVDGARDIWFTKSVKALNAAGFKKIVQNETLFQITADYKKATVWGGILISLLPADKGQTVINMKSTANVDNIYALFKSPNKAILDRFKSELK